MATVVVRTRPGAKVAVEQVSHEFWFGTAVSGHVFSGRIPTSDRDRYLAVLKKNFNAVVPENAMKWYSIERRRGRKDYAAADRIVDWSLANGMRIRGHCVYWAVDEFVQDWIKKMDDDALEPLLQARAGELLGRYRGKVTEFDLNNEMVHGDYYVRRFGESVRKRMFNWAKEANPEAVLYLNDFNILNGGDFPKYEKQIESLLAQGAPVGGIGLQGHFDRTVDRAKVKRILDDLSRFDLPVKITEFDMKTMDEAAKAKGLEDLYRTAFEHPTVDGILMWGFWAKLHWRGSRRWGTQGYTALWDQDWKPTPSADTYRRLVFDEWWTRFEGTADAKGLCRVPVFLGKHRITVDGRESVVELTTPREVREVAQQ